MLWRRFDDRGVGKSTGEYFGASWEEFAADALAMLEQLRSEPRIDRDQIGFAGMSQGGAIGALVAASSDDVAFMILMSAPGLSGKATLQLQLDKTLELSGIDGEMADKYRKMSTEFFEIISGDPQLAETRDRLRGFFSGPGGSLVPPYQFVPKDIDGRIEMFLGPWYRSNVLFDPQNTYGSLCVPTLIIGGLLDPVAPPESHVTNIVAILAASSQAPITARLLPGVNHLMQDAKTGLPTEYAALDNSISPVVLEIVKDWVLKQRLAAQPTRSVSDPQPTRGDHKGGS